MRWDARHIKRIPGREGAHWEEATELHGKKWLRGGWVGGDIYSGEL